MHTRTISILIFLASFLGGLIYATPSAKIRLASDYWPPYTDIEGNRSVAISLVSEALSRMEYEAVTEMVDSGNLSKSIEDGNFDGSAALWKNKERQQWLLFSEPYLQNRMIVVSQNPKISSVQSVSELSGKSVGIIGNWAYDDAFLETPGITFVKSLDQNENLELLLKGDIDALLIDDMLWYYEFEEKYPNLSVSKSSLIKEGLHFALRKDFPEANYIMGMFNYTISKMKLDGSYNHLLEIEWIEVDLNGDGVNELIHGGSNIDSLVPERSFKLHH